MKQLKEKILEALISALPITAIVYLMSLLPWFTFTATELITFTVGAVFLVLGIGLFNLGADLAMTPMGNHVGSGLSARRNCGSCCWSALCWDFSLPLRNQTCRFWPIR